MNPEVPKRLTPTQEVLRELYLRSGNVCAYPGCRHPVVNAEGTYIAQICHIEAALPDASRFNANSSNEIRRSYENLMIMCHRHHVETHDETQFPFAKMREIKRNHEQKFARIIEDLTGEIYDTTLTALFINPNNINRLVVEIDPHSSDINVIKLGVPEIGSALQKLPPETRRIFSLLVSHVSERDSKVSQFKFLNIVSLPKNDTFLHLCLLEKERLAWNDMNPDPTETAWVLAGPQTSASYPVASYLKQYGEKIGVSLDTFFVALNFSSLEEKAV